MSSVFFGGRLITTPTTASVVEDSGLANKNLSVGNVTALIGRSAGGKPGVPLRFGSPSEARAVLGSGELCDAIVKAFDPSAQTGSPQTVIGLRVNPAVQASLNLLDSASAPVIVLQSTDYGQRANQVKIKVEAGSTIGKKITTQIENDYASADNVARNAFRVRYTGAAASAIMTTSSTSVLLQAPTGTTVATIDLNAFPTVQQLVDRINAVSGFSASVQDGNGAKPTLNGLDFVTGQDVKTADFIQPAHLQAVIDWISGTAEGFVNATRPANVGTLPVNMAFTYLSGGSDGIVTNTQWAAAYTALQSLDVQWVTPLSSDASIHAMNDSHCAYMSNVGKRERRGICGMASGSTDEAALAAAKALNSDRTSLVHVGYYDYDAEGKLVLFPPYMLAALLAGAFAGVNPGTPLTNKTIKVRGLERNVRNPTDTDILLPGGVLCVEETEEGFKVVQSITTWLADDNYNRVEISTGVCVDYTARSTRKALDVLRGQKASPILLGRAKSITESTLRELARPEPQGIGVLVGDENSPAFRNVVAYVDADVVRVDYECQPAIGVNYVLVSIFPRAYSGSTAA